MRSLIGRRLITYRRRRRLRRRQRGGAEAAGLIAKFSTSIFRQAARCRAISRLCRLFELNANAVLNWGRAPRGTPSILYGIKRDKRVR